MKIFLNQLFFVLIFLLLCLQIFVNLASLNNTYWYPSDLRVNIVTGTLNIGELNSNQSLVRVAPYQDFYYGGGKRQSLNFLYLYSLNKPSEIENLTHSLFSPTRWVWHDSKEKIDYKYDFVFSSNSITIIRSIYSPNQKINSLGQSLYYCSSCVVLDPQTRLVYYYFQDFYSPTLQKVLDLNFRLAHLPNKIISGVSQLTILDLESGRQVAIQLMPGQIANLEDSDHILELPSPVIRNGNWQTTKVTITIPYE